MKQTFKANKRVVAFLATSTQELSERAKSIAKSIAKDIRESEVVLGMPNSDWSLSMRHAKACDHRVLYMPYNDYGKTNDLHSETLACMPHVRPVIDKNASTTSIASKRNKAILQCYIEIIKRADILHIYLDTTKPSLLLQAFSDVYVAEHPIIINHFEQELFAGHPINLRA